ncbi:MAG TPA: cysteine desulfurase family protein [Candidatus Hypogeohydataceae bacterium YC41]
MNRIYLDNSITTRLDPLVLEEMLPFLEKSWGSSTQIHSFGRETKNATEKARGRVVQVLGVMPEEIIFTSGGTEANNLAIRGVAKTLGYKGRVITTQVEHPSVTETCRALQEEGHEAVFVPMRKEGIVHPEDVKKALTSKTFLISIIFAEGETGAIQPVEEIALIAKERGILFHTDACQVVGKVRLPLERPGIDLLTISAHKFHGPMGVGVLFIRTGTRLKPILSGGDEEFGLRPGTVSPPLALGLARALELAEEQREANTTRIKHLEEQLLSGIKGIFEAAQLNGPPDARLPGHLSMRFPGLEAASLLLNLDLEGIAVGAGKPCVSGALEVSSVLLAMGLSREEALSSLDFSMSRFNTSEEIARTVAALAGVVSRIRTVYI